VELRRLGRSGLEVSRLSLGAMTFGQRMPPISNVDAAAAAAMFERALDAGINFVDTADAYSGGESEEILAPLVARHRDSIIVATKVGMGSGPERPLSRPNVIAGVERSLRRLGIDRIDVLYLHRPDRSTSIDETFDTLDELVERGLVRAVGTSNWTSAETAYATGRQRALGRVEPTSVQVYWSLVGRDVEQEIAPASRRLDMGLVVWSPLAGGYLSGRTDGRRSVWAFPPVEPALGERVMSVLRRVAGDLDLTPAQVALAWLLNREELTSVIVGASTVAQLEENLRAEAITLDEDSLAKLDEASAAAPNYPRWWDSAMGVS
jgi:aryl-alcohol dehydrogenase-like predicted oxidoreductase